MSMRQISEIVAQMEERVRNIPQTIQAQKAQGKKVVGLFPYHAPEELIYAAGMFPIACWGGRKTIAGAASVLPPFACPVMQSITESTLDGTYGLLDGAILTAPCDTLKCLTQNFLLACPQVKAIFCLHPQNNQIQAGYEYILREYRAIGKQLEALSGKPITQSSLQTAIALCNANRQAMMEFSRLTAEKPGLLTNRQRYYVMKSRRLMEKGTHTALMRELNAAMEGAPAPSEPKLRVYLAGILAEPVEFLEILDSLGYAVVGDELAGESRLFRNPVPAGLDPYENLARQWQNVEGDSLVCDFQGKRGEIIARDAQQVGAHCVLYCQMKFCEVEEFDYVYIKKRLDEQGTASLNLEMDPNNFSLEQTETRLQALAEQLHVVLA